MDMASKADCLLKEEADSIMEYHDAEIQAAYFSWHVWRRGTCPEFFEMGEERRESFGLMAQLTVLSIWEVEDTWTKAEHSQKPLEMSG